ncbi:hypothetical protein EDC01DRAFT_781046 [Geopyxis carbonaria]|nr:hypothetical protein EDC01DRAFT_781046 [Geopyxis carbonaria]
MAPFTTFCGLLTVAPKIFIFPEEFYLQVPSQRRLIPRDAQRAARSCSAVSSASLEAPGRRSEAPALCGVLSAFPSPDDIRLTRSEKYALDDIGQAATAVIAALRKAVQEAVTDAFRALLASRRLRLPADITLDAQSLLTRWSAGDTSPDLLRGIPKTTRTKPLPGHAHRTTTSSALAKPYPFRRDPSTWWPLQLCALRDGAHGSTEAGSRHNARRASPRLALDRRRHRPRGITDDTLQALPGNKHRTITSSALDRAWSFCGSPSISSSAPGGHCDRRGRHHHLRRRGGAVEAGYDTVWERVLGRRGLQLMEGRGGAVVGVL